MPTDFISPGVGGFPDTVVSDPSKFGAFPSKAALKSGSVQVFRPNMGFNIVITGLNVAAEHWQAMGDVFPAAVWTIQNRAGEEMSREGRIRISEYGAVDSGDTLRSIHHFLSTTSDSVTVSTGPTTFYAPFIEYGLAAHSAPHIGPRPFMMDAMFAILPEWIHAFNGLATIARKGTRGRFPSGPYKSPIDALLANVRARLYSIEKAIGDTVILPGVSIAPPGTSRFRERALGGARVIGDVQSVLGRVVGTRFQRRLTGKVTGRLIGVGSRTVFVNKTVGARISGAERIYNKQAGKALSGYVDQSRFFGGG